MANSGTTMRFLTAMLALGHGTYRLDGTPRMRERPIVDLLDALRQLGGDAISEPETAARPWSFGRAGSRAARQPLAGMSPVSSSAGCLMAAPYANGDVELVVWGQELVSKPYVDMTLAVMRSFGVQVGTDEPGRLKIAAPQCYRPQRYAIEPDASAASYFFAAAAITGGEVTVEGLSRNSLQGDVHFCDCLERMGCEVRYGQNHITVVGHPLHGIKVRHERDQRYGADARRSSACLPKGRPPSSGVAHIRHKETDRIHALAVELRKLGAEVDEYMDGLKITPRPCTARRSTPTTTTGWR